MIEFCKFKVAIDQSNNSTPVSEESLEEVSKTEYSIPDASSIQAFMSQAADLVQCVKLTLFMYFCLFSRLLVEFVFKSFWLYCG